MFRKNNKFGVNTEEILSPTGLTRGLADQVQCQFVPYLEHNSRSICNRKYSFNE